MRLAQDSLQRLGTKRGTILVTGGSGQVGYELVRALAPLGNVVAPSSRELDLTDLAGVRAVVRAIAPAVIVNAAAYTNVDRAENDQDRCFAINAEAPRVLTEEAQRLGSAFVHYSSDYVFDGTKVTPYTEEDAPCPANVYGESKLAGERAIAKVGGGYLILRTSWVYGARGTNFLRSIRRLARERRELKVVSDQIGAPTWSRAIADTTALLLGSLLVSDERFADNAARASGVYNMTAGESTSWYGFANAIIEDDPQKEQMICERVVPVTTAEYGALAPRPLYSVLDNTKLRARVGCVLPDWRALLGLVLQDLACVR
ncbi:MAG: dTDP-4-dehydrorhamnose reductase [Gemmatimonadaceae bacterium]